MISIRSPSSNIGSVFYSLTGGKRESERESAYYSLIDYLFVFVASVS